jgi:hypothetical protein
MMEVIGPGFDSERITLPRTFCGFKRQSSLTELRAYQAKNRNCSVEQQKRKRMKERKTERNKEIKK